jgi:hypothetical protein
MTSAISAERATEKAATDAVVEAKEITRVYGEGETASRALNGCSVATRILFLADGCIVNELKGADQSEIVGAVDAVSRQ